MNKAVIAVPKGQIRKLRAHAEHLLDEFIALREKYSLLHPMIFDDDLTARVTQDRVSIEGFKMLRRVLFMSCVQDIAKLSSDRYPTSTSLAKCATSLANNGLREHLRNEYAAARQSAAATVMRGRDSGRSRS